MSNPFNKLTDFNHSQVRKYLNFFRNKRQSSLRALSSEFSDLKHDRYPTHPYPFLSFYLLIFNSFTPFKDFEIQCIQKKM